MPRTDAVLVSWVALNNDPFELARGERQLLDGQPVLGPTLTLLFDEESAYRGKIKDVVIFAIRRPEDRVGESGDEKAASELFAEIRHRSNGGIKCHLHVFCHSDPTDHQAIFQFVRAQVPDLRRSFAARELVIHVSPGTPSMQTIWVLMAECGFIERPYVVVKSYRQRDRKRNLAVVPFSVGIETFYKVYERSRPKSVSSPDQAVKVRVGELRSKALRELYHLAGIYARSRHPILLLGERGTGKTSLAEWIRSASPYQKADLDGRWPSIPCGYFRPETMRSELFGYKRGAFTGADRDRKGLLEIADGDTVFFDEIGDMTPELQRLLIRAIEERAFSPIGDERIVRSEFRPIFATNLPLHSLRDKLHPDFYDRIKMFRLRVPPLREIGEDIPMLWRSVWERELGRSQFPPSIEQCQRIDEKRLLEGIRHHPLPGNIRDLILVAAHLILFLTNDLPGDPVGFALEQLPGDTAGGSSRAIVQAFATGENIDHLLPEGARLSIDDAFDEFRYFLADQIRRIARQRGVKQNTLCDLSDKSIRNWKKLKRSAAEDPFREGE